MRISRRLGGFFRAVAFVGAALLAYNVYSASNAFKLNKNAVPVEDIYYGNIPESGRVNNPGLVTRFDIVKETPEYEPIASGRAKEGTGAYPIALSTASDRSLRWIINYGKENKFDVIFERRDFVGAVKFDEEYKRNTLEEVTNALENDLDITELIIKANK